MIVLFVIFLAVSVYVHPAAAVVVGAVALLALVK